MRTVLTSEKRIRVRVSVAVAVCLAALLAVSLTFAFAARRTAASDDGWSDASVQAEYAYGETFRVPQRTYTQGANTYNAAAVVTLPDGSRTKNTEIALDNAGRYVITYSAQAGDTLVTDELSFKVQYPAFSYSSDDTSVSYGKGNYASGNHRDGLLVRLAQGDSLTFTQLIDTTTLTKDDYLFTGYVTPDMREVADFTRLYFTLTDSQNPEIYMQLLYCSYFFSKQIGGYSYCEAAGNGQQLSGWHERNQELRVNDGYGANSDASFMAWRGNSTGGVPNFYADTYLFTFRFDPQTMKVYGTCASLEGEVIDLDEEKYFGSNLWKGFPSGKARLSVSASNYSSATANFCVLSTYGCEEGYYTPEHASYLDTEGPEITFADVSEELPPAVVGKSYPVPTASAYDLYSGEAAVKVSAWYNYGSPTAVSVPIKDGKIDINRFGYYTLEYTSCDALGNESKETLWVIADGSVGKVDFDLPDGLPQSASVGEFVVLPLGVKNVTGGSGNTSVRISVASPSGETAAAEGGFRITEPGEYTVTYSAVDYVGQETRKTHTLNVSDADSVVLGSAPVFFPLYVSGAKYLLPEINVYVYENSELEIKPCTVRVTDGEGTETYEAGSEFVPEVKNNGDGITFAVEYDGIQYGTYTAKAVFAYVYNERYDTEDFTEQNYFFGEGFTVGRQSDDRLRFTGSGKEYGWTFANALSAKNFRIVLSDIANEAPNAKIRVTLSDAYGSSLVSAVLENRSDGAYLTADGKTAAQLDGYLSAKPITLGFENNAFVYNGAYYTVTACDDGSPFGGFASGKVFLSLSVDSADQGSSSAHRFMSFTLESLSGHQTSSTYENYSVPEIVIEGVYGGAHSLGEVVTLPSAYAYDVFSPMIEFTVTVRKNGEVMRDENGVLLENADPTKEYRIRLTDFGRYTVQYYAAAYGFTALRANNFTSYTINVYDDEPPIITYSTGYYDTAKVGDTLRMPRFTVSDNMSDDITVNIFIRLPDGKLMILSEGEYKADMRGVYEFRLMVTDQAGNTVIDRFAVTVN